MSASCESVNAYGPGYRDDGVCLAPPAKDWLVTKLIDHGPKAYYRYTVEGRNLNWHPSCRDYNFRWSCPTLSHRYDLSLVT